ncbi:transmembrane protein 186 isoform X2 [Carcharodon carcharias]|uniref:transmembrane protein 186 isoform X2 n=1 Tax=Carcharodon carcharias TaxID=13397 RepID=UPI001B7F214B|nr:transmembrane protein 186 isoform X2 [Carcharodon carcharias]
MLQQPFSTAFYRSWNVMIFKNILRFCQMTCHSRSLLPVCASSTQKKAVIFGWLNTYAVPYLQVAKLHPKAHENHMTARGQIQHGQMSADVQEHQGQSKPKFPDNEHFTAIYKFQGIRFLRAISQLKILQTGITVALLPTVYYFYLLEQIQYALLSYITGLSGFAIIMLYSMSYYLRRFIGMLYLNELGTTLKVSHLSFWGRRKDFYVPVEDVMPLGDTGDTANEIILQFKQYNSTEVFYFTVKFGQVVDKQKFLQVFGGLQ